MSTDAFNFEINGIQYADLKDEFIELATTLLPNWDCTNVNDPVVYFSEFYLQSLSRIAYVANVFTQECMLSTARHPQSVRNIANMLGYESGTAQPAKVDMTLTYSITGSTTLKPYSLRVATKQTDGNISVYYENINEVVLSATSTSAVVKFVEGQTRDEDFVGTGTPNQRLFLQSFPVIIENLLSETLTVKVDSVEWDRKSTFGDAISTDKYFRIEQDVLDRMTIIFGDGVNGAMPPKDASINVVYRVGGGARGIVNANEITEIITGFTGLTSVTNVNVPDGASEKESIVDIKKNAPLSLIAPNQINRIRELEIYVEAFSGVARCKVIQQGTLLKLYVVPVAGTSVEDIKPSLSNEISKRLVMGFVVVIADADYYDPTIDIDIDLDSNISQDLAIEQTKTAILNLIDSLVKDDDGKYINQFGGGLRRADIGFVVRTIDGVFDYVINEPAADITFNAATILRNTNANVKVRVSTGGTTTGSYDDTEIASQGTITSRSSWIS